MLHHAKYYGGWFLSTRQMKCVGKLSHFKPSNAPHDTSEAPTQYVCSRQVDNTTYKYLDISPIFRQAGKIQVRTFKIKTILKCLRKVCFLFLVDIWLDTKLVPNYLQSLYTFILKVLPIDIHVENKLHIGHYALRFLYQSIVRGGWGHVLWKAYLW